MTAGSGDELSNMLATIMQLAGQNKPVSAAPPLDNTPPAGTLEPTSGDSPADAMRSFIDKLNPMGGDDVSKSHGDLDNDGDHDMDDHDMEKDKPEDEEVDPEDDDIMTNLNKELKPYDDQVAKNKEKEGEEKTDEWANEPEEDYKDVDFMVNKLAGGMNRPKGQHKHGYAGGDNPRAMPESVDLKTSIKNELRSRLAEAKARGAK
jgi:hypothetical protein